MTNTPAVSVIIPMFNAEKFVGDCLESILAQTFQDFEVIVADDCSIDSSAAIVESFAPKFNGRLKLLQLDCNTGSPAAPRNAGLKFSRGEYVFFMDADDMLTLTALEELFTLAKNFDAEVVYCERFYSVSADFQKVYISTEQKGALVNKPTLESENLAVRVKDILRGQFWVTPWLKFVRRDLLVDNEIFFPPTRTSQDDIWTYGLVFHAKRFLRVPNVVYVYRYSENSIQRTRRCPEERIKFGLNPVVFGLKSLDNFMSNVEFFQKNLRYRCAVLEFFVHAKIGALFDASLELQPIDIYEAIKAEFGKHLGDRDVLVAWILTDLIVQQKIFVADRRRLDELEKKVRK